MTPSANIVNHFTNALRGLNDPDNAEAVHKELIAQSSKFEQAISLLDAVIDRHSDGAALPGQKFTFVDALRQRATVYYATGRPELGDGDLDQELGLYKGKNAPIAFEVHATRARLRYQAGRVDEAFAEVNRLAKEGKLSASTWFELASIYATESSKNEADRNLYLARSIALLDKAVDAGLFDYQSWRDRPELEPLRNQPKFQQLEATVRSRDFAIQADKLRGDGDYRAALEAYDMALKLQPKTKGCYPSPVDQQYCRSILLIQKRNTRVPILETFDQPENSVSCTRRLSSVVAAQRRSPRRGDLLIALWPTIRTWWIESSTHFNSPCSVPQPILKDELVNFCCSKLAGLNCVGCC